MLTSLEIAGLRGIQKGVIKGLRQLTVFVGPNGCGKSTVLEAAGVACAGLKAERAFRALADREWLGLAGMAYWCDQKTGASVTGRFEPSPMDENASSLSSTSLLRAPVAISSFLAATKLTSSTQSGQRLEHGASSIHVQVNDDGSPEHSSHHSVLVPFEFLGTFSDRAAGARERLASARFSSALRDALTAIKRAPWYDDFESYLRELRPKVDHIESLAVDDRDEPFIIEKDPRTVYPVAYAGDGFRRALLLAATLAGAKGGVAALDEPEAFAHPRMGRELARLFRRSLDDGTQILISTHSLEFIEIVLHELKDTAERIAVVGLTMTGGVLSPMMEYGADAYRRIVEMRDDLRL
jgi:energy-coupling factor transporter ATP-binding protein EcfA2